MLQPLQQTFQQPVQNLPHYEIPKVNGRDGANAFQLGPNSAVFLMDQASDGIVIYLVTTDGAGYKTVTQIDGAIHQDSVVEAPDTEVVNRLTAIEKRLDHFEEMLK